MKTLASAALVAVLAAGPVAAGSLDNPWGRAPVAKPACPVYGILWGLVKWESCPRIVNTVPDDGDDHRSPDPKGPKDPKDPKDPRDPKDPKDPKGPKGDRGNPGNDKSVGKSGEQDKGAGSSGGTSGASTGKTGGGKGGKKD